MKRTIAFLLAVSLIGGTLAMTSCEMADILEGIEMPTVEGVATPELEDDKNPNKNNGNNGNHNGNNENHNGNNGNHYGNDKDNFLGKKPHELYKEKVKEAKDSSNYTVKVEAVNRVEMMGVSTSTEEKVTVKIDDKKFSAEIVSDFGDAEGNSEQKLWCVDGYIYTEMDADLVKELIDEADVASQIEELKASYETFIFDLTDEYFEGAVFNVDEKGAHLSVTLTAKQISELLTEATGIEHNISTEDCVVDVAFDFEGNLSGYVFELEGKMSQTAFGYTTEYDVYMLYNIEFSERGNTKVEHPKHADKFVEKGHGKH